MESSRHFSSPVCPFEIAKLQSWHCAFFCLAWHSEKSRIYFLQNFANGGHREIAIMTLRFLLSYLAFRKKSKLIFSKFRKWRPSRNCHHYTALSLVLLGVQKKVEINFCKISRMVTIAKLPSWHCAFSCLAWHSEKSRIYFLQNFANGGHREIAIMTLRFLLSSLAFRKKSKLVFAKFREWWPSRIGHHDTMLFFVLLDA